MTPAEMLARLEADGNALAEAVKDYLASTPHPDLKGVMPTYRSDENEADLMAVVEAVNNWDKRLWRATADEPRWSSEYDSEGNDTGRGMWVRPPGFPLPSGAPDPWKQYPPCGHCGSTVRPGVSTCPRCGPYAHGRPTE